MRVRLTRSSLVSLRAQLLGAAGLAVLATVGLGAFGAATVGTLNTLVHSTYDQALMASTFAQSAQANFVRTDRAFRRAVVAREVAELDKQATLASKSLRASLDDLRVVEDRSLGAKATELATAIRRDVEAWEPRRLTLLEEARHRLGNNQPPLAATADDLSARIESNLEALSDQATEAGFNFRETAGATGRLALRVTYIGMAIAVIVCLVSFWLLARRIVRPILGLVDHLNALAAGDLTGRMADNRRDEIGEVARAYNSVAAQFGEMVRGIVTTASGLSGQAQQLSDAIEGLRAGARDQATAIEATGRSLDGMTASVQVSRQHTGQARQVAAESKANAERDSAVVRSAMEAMAAITTSSKRIGDILSTINEIAFQTNLLALNAAVEAARAGDHGRGFAVVASEVRSLAQRCVAASKEIKELIDASLGTVETGADLVNRSGQTLEQIVTAVQRVNELIGEVAASSETQTTGLAEVERSVREIERITGVTVGEADQLGATAHALADQAVELEARARRFRLDGAEDMATAGDDEPAARFMDSARSEHRDSPQPAGELAAV
jgi:methyl-accepting chemotaxis protein